MNENASREILWNVNYPATVVIMYAIFACALLVTSIGIFRRLELWLAGQEDTERQGSYWKRFCDLFSWGLLQRGVLREQLPSIGHSLIFVGFLVLLFTTTMVFLEQDLGIPIYRGNFYLATTVLSDVFGLGLIIGCGIMAHRRYIQKADLVHSRFADGFFLGMLALLCVQGYLLEGLRIKVTADPWAAYSPVGLLTANFFWFISDNAASFLHLCIWWFHTVSVFAFIALLPYTKFFHIVGSSLNLYFKERGRPRGALRSPGDLEAMIEAGEDFSIGTGTIKDYSWKQLLDLDSCTSCGRCQAVCPAYAAEKPLSPKWLMLDTRNHMLGLMSQDKLAPSKLPAWMVKIDNFLMEHVYLRSSGVVASKENGFEAQGSYRGQNKAIHSNVLSLGNNADDTISGTVLDPDVFWSCTTCGACVEACPVGIEHVDHIVENRRHMVLMEGQIPSEAQATLRALENRGNPFGPADDRIKWSEGLEVPVLKAGDSVDYLYWVGCVSAFDPRKQKIAQSLVKIFNHLGLSYGILGNAERCSGDPARRLGEENLFQLLVKQNIETMSSVKFKTIVTNCPHCFNSLKNEYPQFGDIGENNPSVLHHSQLLQSFLAEGRLDLQELEEKYTFHDPCYLGRFNDEYEAPRDTLKGVPSLKILEIDQNKEKGMCCGAGGGHFWMDKKEGERINVLRVDQVAQTAAPKVATACPFCMQMLEDGVKLTNREDDIIVEDIAEVIAAQLS